MVQLSDKEYEEFRKISKEEGVSWDSKESMRQAANDLYELADIALKVATEELLAKVV